MVMYYLKTGFYILTFCWPCGCWQASCFCLFREDLVLVPMPLASCFSNVFGHFYHDFILNVPKVVVLSLFGHDFNFLNSIFLPLTVSWPCCLATLSLVLFFWLFKSYFVYKTQDIVKLIFYGRSLRGGGTTEIRRWRLSKDRMGEIVELRNDCEYKGP